MTGHRVLFVPLAVSDDLGDQRTGLVLSRGTRDLASANACSRVSKTWSDGTIACPTHGTSAQSVDVVETQRRFALDEPITGELWERLRSSFHADYALLFRPESVSSTNEVSRKYATKDERMSLLMTEAIRVSPLAALITSERIKPETTSETELGYTISAVLVDIRTGKVLKVGVNSGSESKTVHRNLGYAEAPPAAPLLEKIVADLAEEVLSD